MPRYNRRRRNNKRKWRQQKVSVGTIQKIAKRVARVQIAKKEEPKYSVTTYGTVAAGSDVDCGRCVITKTGIYAVDTGAINVQSVWQQAHQHAPITYPIQGTAAAAPINSGDRKRIGDTIHLKGISIKGYLLLGKDCPSATVHMGLYKADQTLSNPVTYLPRLDGQQVRRDIADFEKLNGTKCKKTWHLNHRSAEDTVKIPVNLYFKANRRVRYNTLQPSETNQSPMQQTYYTDDRYYFICYSDRKNDGLTGGIASNTPNADLESERAKFPQFYGSMRCYYRDA